MCLFFLVAFLGADGGIVAQTNSEATLLYVDDINVTPRQTFEMHRDDLVRVDAYGLAPLTTFTLEAKRNGLRFFSQTYESNERGEVKAVLIFPKISSKITCTASYTTQNDKSRRIRFFLQPPPE